MNEWMNERLGELFLQLPFKVLSFLYRSNVKTALLSPLGKTGNWSADLKRNIVYRNPQHQNTHNFCDKQ